MRIIHELSDDVINKIAAGEVVERPASVVKELVENSLDAGSDRVEIHLTSGGIKEIIIKDNGRGISYYDLPVALQRHATSKLFGVDDLYRLETMGFRGEALPSIASVSKMKISSREHDNVEGFELFSEGGKNSDVRPCGMPKGSVVTVRDLFFNVPARQKFLKRPATELNHIVAQVNKLAIAYPDVSFSLTNDGRNLISFSACTKARTRIEQVFKNVRFYSVNKVVDDHTINAYVSAPEDGVVGSGKIYLYVNRRCVRDKTVINALKMSYRSLIEDRKYPQAVVFLTLPGDKVDINVHPTKQEVKFSDTNAIYKLVFGAIRDEMKTPPWLVPPRIMTLKSGEVSETRPAPVSYLNERSRTNEDMKSPEDHPSDMQAVKDSERDDSEQGASFYKLSFDRVSEKVPLIGARENFSSLKFLNQIGATYLVFSRDDELVVIDQHAAHERVLFEVLKGRYIGKRNIGQMMLVPKVVRLDSCPDDVLQRKIEFLDRAGFQVEVFGENSLLVKAVPTHFALTDAYTLVENIVNEIELVSEAGEEMNASVEKILHDIACKAAIKANRNLSMEEIKALLAELDRIDFSTNCPHGRPVFIRFTIKDLEKQFKRV